MSHSAFAPVSIIVKKSSVVFTKNAYPLWFTDYTIERFPPSRALARHEWLRRVGSLLLLRRRFLATARLARWRPGSSAKILFVRVASSLAGFGPDDYLLRGEHLSFRPRIDVYQR